MNNKLSKDNYASVRLGVIGLGMMGKIHVEKASQIDDCEIIAICDIDPSTKGLSEKLGIKSYHDHIEMLDSERLDGVIISLSNELHETIGIDCAKKGLDILMEKPIASSVKAAKKLINSVNKNKVRMLVAHQRRFNSKINVAREIIQAGDLGEMVVISVIGCMHKPDKYFLDGLWRKKKISGGLVLINMIHEIDVLRYTFGEIERVYAEVSNKIRKFEVEDSVSVTIRFKEGALATILMSDTVPSMWGYDCNMGEIPIFYKIKGEAYTFMGTKGSLIVPGMKKVYYPDSSMVGWQHPLKIDNIKVDIKDPYIQQLKHFCNVVKGKEDPRTSGEDALKTLEVTMAILESGHKNKPVKISI
jgi:predicted dehydrogenase